VAEELLIVEELRAAFLTPSGALPVLDGVSFRIRRGEVFGLCGESGSGKSTLALVLLRLLRPPGAITGGRVHFEGDDVLGMDEVALRALRWRRISLVTQEAMNALNPVLTVGDQLADPIIAHQRLARRTARERAAQLLELVAVDTVHLASYPHELSGGMRQRVVLAMALALAPALVIMDEPTTALDAVVRAEILDRLASLRELLGFSVLLIDHDLALLSAVCARVGVLYAGRLVETLPAAALATGARHPYTQALARCVLDPRVKQSPRLGIGGAPPSLAALPSGCHFHPRCSEVMERCRHSRPLSLPLAPGHQVACHLCS
jgi:peptide/nickel transport system ATP-binding protein